MKINLIGKFGNTWGAEWLIKEGFEQLGHDVSGFNIAHGYAMLRGIQANALTVVLQGYGMAPKLIEAIQRISKRPVVLWHAEVMSPGLEITDPVVLAKYDQLRQNAYAFDAIGHNCHCCLDLIRAAQGAVGQGKPVFWAPNNGVSASRHYRIDSAEKKYLIGFYGHPSPRRLKVIYELESKGIGVTWRKPEDGCYGDELTTFINSCHVMLNLHYSETQNTECRVYESLGCGVPLISEPISMPELFPQQYCGIGYFANTDELLSVAKYRLFMAEYTPDDLRNQGSMAMEWLHANASYAQRCDNFLKQIEANLS